ncbi:hypothetical protein SMICM304S_11081 [Streptomyces microflavus]
MSDWRVRAPDRARRARPHPGAGPGRRGGEGARRGEPPAGPRPDQQGAGPVGRRGAGLGPRAVRGEPAPSPEEWRLQLTEARLDLDLEVGSHAEAVSELTALTAAHPLRERLRELLMVALYRSGRQAEALAVYADTRRLLSEELGVDPRPELAQLQQRILRADEELAQPADEPAPAAAPLKPAQLPATVPDFTGRDSLRTGPGRPTGLRRGFGDGRFPPWPGSAASARRRWPYHMARRPHPHFPDGQLYVDLQGAGARAAEPRRSSASSCGRSARRTRRSRTRWTSGPRSTARRWTAAASWSSSTTPTTPPRSARCCPARPAARRW